MEDLKIQEVDSDNEEFTSFFKEKEQDIEQYFPHYSEEDAERGFVLILKVEETVIGAFVYQTKGQEVHIDLDYVIPNFRDKGIGMQLFEQKTADFERTGFKTMITLTDNPAHINYITKLGFQNTEIHPDRYEKQIN